MVSSIKVSSVSGLSYVELSVDHWSEVSSVSGLSSPSASRQRAVSPVSCAPLSYQSTVASSYTLAESPDSSDRSVEKICN